MSDEKPTCRFCLRAHGPGATMCASCGAPLVGPEADAVAKADVKPVEASAPRPDGEVADEPEEDAPVVTGAAALAAAGLPVGGAGGEDSPVRRAKAGADPATLLLLVLGCALIAGSMMRRGPPSSTGVLPAAPPAAIAPARQVAIASTTTLAPTWMSARKDAVTFQPPLEWRATRALFAFDSGHLVSMASEADGSLTLAMHMAERPAGDPVRGAQDRFHVRMPEARFSDGRRVRVGLNDGVELLGTSGDKNLLVVYAWNGRRAVHIAFLAPPGPFERLLPVFRASAATLRL